MTPDSPVAAAMAFLERGGPAIWTIAALSLAMAALILWKAARLLADGAWSGGARSDAAVALWCEGQPDRAEAAIVGRRSYRARLVRAAMAARLDPGLTPEAAEAETTRVARGLLAEARSGLRGLELIATIAPLVGLLGTVLGMISAFQGLETSGARADPAVLAGGIWEALLTTAAGMAVAIPASVALTWFDAVTDRLRHDMEDAATRIFLRAPGRPAVTGLRAAAE